MNIKGTKSEQNIKAAFAGESQARARYTFFAEAAKAEGNAEVEQLFERMAKNELAHARMWFKLLHDGLGESASNITEAAAGENTEWQSMYPGFAKDARAEGLEDLATMFEKVAEIESSHERTFLQAFIKLASEKGLPKAKVQEKVQEPVAEPLYRCQFCGMGSDKPLDVCPVCQAIGAFERI
ncbi:MAG: ferritin family protein [Oscillospiraceae bacterium]